MSGYLDTRELSEELEGLRERVERRTELATELEEAGWPAVAEDVRDGIEPDTLLSRLAAISEDTSEAAEMIAAADLDDLEPDERERMDELSSVLDEIGSEARYGVNLIPEHLFEDYARDFASDIGAIDDDARWPCTCIDWERAARELAMDFTSVEIDGTSYYYRA